MPQQPGTVLSCSDDRSPEVFKTRIEAATQMKSVLGTNEKPNCLIIDEIDGAPTVSLAWIWPRGLSYCPLKLICFRGGFLL